jgi:phosphoserine phosphatase
MQKVLRPSSQSEAKSLVSEVVAEHRGGCVIADFDETLLLANSTELYLEAAHPRMLSALISKSVAVFLPRTFLRCKDARDIYLDLFRVLAVTLLMPWTYLTWRWIYARKVSQEFVNSALLEALAAAGRKVDIVASLGFAFIIRPVCKRIVPDAHLIASGIGMAQTLRRNGKLPTASAAIRVGTIGEAIVITDSNKDDDILSACGSGILIEWPNCRAKAAFSDVYYPFLYTAKVKRPGEKYISSVVILTDAVAASLAYAWFLPQPVLAAFSICILQLSIWTVYEVGYFENDKAAAQERSGHIPDAYSRYEKRMKPALAWIWAISFSVLGVLLFSVSEMPAAFDAVSLSRAAELLLIWLLFLAAVRASFHFYNRVEGKSRLFLYPLLQLARLGGYALIASTNFVGSALVAALVISRWIPYIIYRASGVRWYEYNKVLLACIFLVIVMLSLPANIDGAGLLHLLVVLAWLGCRSSRQVMAAVRNTTFVAR